MTLVSTAEFVQHRREAGRSPSGLPLTIHRPLAACRGTVVLVPGWSGPRSGPADILVFLASEFARAGWLAVRFDLLGRGDASGEFKDCDLDRMIGAAVEVAQTKASGSALFVLGMCSGGNVALAAACSDALRAKNIGVIALSTLPFQPARSTQFEQRRRLEEHQAVRRQGPQPRHMAAADQRRG